MKKTALTFLLIFFLIPSFLKFSVQPIFAISSCGLGDIQNFTATVNGNQITFVVKNAPPTSNNRTLYILIDFNELIGAKSAIPIAIDDKGNGTAIGSIDTKGSYVAQIFPISDPRGLGIDPCSIAIQFSITTGATSPPAPTKSKDCRNEGESCIIGDTTGTTKPCDPENYACCPSTWGNVILKKTDPLCAGIVQTEQVKTTTPQTKLGPTKYLGPAINICEPDRDEVSSERNPRPAICYLCDKESPLTPSCATSFEVFDEIKYQKKDPEIIKKDWEGNVTVDPTQVKIPFVGKRNMEEEPWGEKIQFWKDADENAKHWFQFWEISNASENKYLADYLEGTNEYYRNYGNQTTITNYQGVLRKLTPFEYQNQLKRDLVLRVGNDEENQIHDYEIKYIGRFCWDTPFWMDAGKFIFDKLATAVLNKTVNRVFTFFSGILDFDDPPKISFKLPDIGHYCLYASIQEGLAGWFVAKTDDFITKASVVKPIYEGLIKLSDLIPGLVHFRHATTIEGNLSDLVQHFPPDPSEEKYKNDLSRYTKDFLEWEKRDDGKWYRLWQATPMLSREDSQGEIDPYLADEHKDDSFNIEEEAKIEAVPHLARLYEGSQIISQILTPTGREIEIVKTSEIAKTTPPYACFREDYLLADESGDGLCCEKITETLTAWEEFKNPYYLCHYDLLNRDTWHCIDSVKKEVSRGFGVNLQHPYLDEIWSYTTNINGGFFNIFRPYGVPAFEDIAAADKISYEYSNGSVSPQQGLFFFPHLGGIQKAKEYVVNEALWPYEEKQ